MPYVNPFAAAQVLLVSTIIGVAISVVAYMTLRVIHVNILRVISNI